MFYSIFWLFFKWKNMYFLNLTNLCSIYLFVQGTYDPNSYSKDSLATQIWQILLALLCTGDGYWFASIIGSVFTQFYRRNWILWSVVTGDGYWFASIIGSVFTQFYRRNCASARVTGTASQHNRLDFTQFYRRNWTLWGIVTGDRYWFASIIGSVFT